MSSRLGPIRVGPCRQKRGPVCATDGQWVLYRAIEGLSSFGYITPPITSCLSGGSSQPRHTRIPGVTTAYTTDNSTTVQPPPAHAPRTYMSFFILPFTVPHLSKYSARRFLYIIDSHFPSFFQFSCSALAPSLTLT